MRRVPRPQARNTPSETVGFTPTLGEGAKRDTHERRRLAPPRPAERPCGALAPKELITRNSHGEKTLQGQKTKSRSKA